VHDEVAAPGRKYTLHGRADRAPARAAPLTGEAPPFLERLPLLSERRIIAYALATALSVLAALLRAELDPWFPPGFPFLTFFPAVIISSFFFGRGPGSLAAVLCGLMAWYYFIPPFHSFAIISGTWLTLVFYTAVVAVDIALVHWMQSANARLRDERERSRALAATSHRLAERNELLFVELQHRVSNNIQVVGAMLALHRRNVSDESARKALDDASRKVTLIGGIQRQLYHITGADTALDAFLNGLARDLAAADNRAGITYDVTVEAGIMLDPDALIPLALIMAEAVANASEHGFADRDNGHIDIAARRIGDQVEMRVTDDGAGLPPTFDLTGSTSLGLKIVTTLARQLGGRFEIGPAEAGTQAVLTIPLKAGSA